MTRADEMRQLAILTFVSVDGIMQSPSAPEEDPSDGFALGGWAAPYWDETMPHVMQNAMAQPYDILFGRKTYNLFAGHWPNAPKSDVGDMLNTARKHVVTSSADALHWQNAQVVSGDVVQEVSALKSTDGPLLQVHGSQQLIQTLHAADLIDTYRLWVFPVILGSGKRLFEPTKTSRSLRLHHCEALENGVVHQVYRTG
ncbi:MAG: dihydrofolate reductase family protein [Pseudomonadota bacterium]